MVRPGLSITRSRASFCTSRARTSRVPSSDMPSAMMISKPPGGSFCARIDRTQASMWSFSFRQGMTIETAGGVLCMVSSERGEGSDSSSGDSQQICRGG